MIRYPYHAGSFYPSRREEIEELFKEFERNRVQKKVEFDILGAVVPHAGYIYSGLTAYNTYSHIFQNKEVKTAIILGPSHYVYFKGIAIYKEGKWLNPFGEAEIDSKLAEELSNTSPFLKAPELHSREHSVEVQVPFIQFFNPNTKIVPLLVGELTLEDMKSAGEKLAEILKKQDAILIASSDLYHGYSYKECVESDRNTISTILSLDPLKFYEASKSEYIMACGEIGINILLFFMRKATDNPQAELIHYTNSADVTGMRGGYVVGYAGIVLGGQNE